MITRGCLALYVVFCLVAGTVQAESKPLELKWSELAPLISSHVVQLTLSTGGTVRGEVATVRDDSLVIDAQITRRTQKLIPRVAHRFFDLP